MHPLNEQHFEILDNLLYFMAVTLLKTLKQSGVNYCLC